MIDPPAMFSIQSTVPKEVPFPLFRPEHAMTLDRPVLVTGTPRSGKSVVAQLLDGLREFTWISEPLMVWDLGLGARPDDRRGAEEATDRLRDQIAESCRSLISDRPGTRYLDDLSYHALRIPFVHAVLPQARIIHVIRRPQDTIPEMCYGWMYKDSIGRAILRRRKAIRPSTLPRHAARFAKNLLMSRIKGRRATWGPRVPGLAQIVAERSIPEIAAYQWMQMVRIASEELKSLPSDSGLEVRFDRLLADPASQASRIAAFCGVRSPEALVEIAKAHIDPAFEFHKRIEPTDAEWGKVCDMIGPFQRELGYAD